ncbi:MAG: hypothetical protein N3A71_03380 [Candidatus Dojkabacteria bacterium]|nr:hypothetical protein [Candidatus Dojkabacteria bacterium]
MLCLSHPCLLKIILEFLCLRYGPQEVIRIEYEIRGLKGSTVSFFDRQPDEIDIPEILVLDDDNECAVEVRRDNRGIIRWRPHSHP